MKLKIDAELCVGCKACEIACSLEHHNVFNPKRANIRVEFTHPLPSAPKYCRQCKKPLCVESCPTGALSRDEEKDMVVYDKEKCIHCLNCIEACPFDSIFYNDTTEEILKCDLCGGDPVCVKFCEKEAIQFIE